MSSVLGSAPPTANTYLKRSAELIKTHVGVGGLPNRNGCRGVTLLDHDGPKTVSVKSTAGVPISDTWRATQEFIGLVASFCDSRTQTKYGRVRDHVVAHFIAASSLVPLMIPVYPQVWESIYRAAVAVIHPHKEK